MAFDPSKFTPEDPTEFELGSSPNQPEVAFDPSKFQPELGWRSIAEPALAIVSSPLGEAAAGYGAGLAMLEGKSPTKAAEAARERFSYQPQSPEGKAALKWVGEKLKPIGDALQSAEQALGDAGYSVAGPTGGAIGKTLPTLAMEALGFGSINRGRNLGFVDPDGNLTRKGEKMIMDRTNSSSLDEAVGKIREAGASRTEPAAEPSASFPSLNARREDLERVTGAVANQNPRTAADLADLDPAIVEAAERLGIEIPHAAASQNLAFVEAAQAAKSLPESRFLIQEANAIAEVQDQVNNWLTTIRRTDDASGFDMDMQRDFEKKMAALTSAAEKGYGVVSKLVPSDTAVDMGSVRNYMDGRLNDLAGDTKELTAVEKRIHRLLKRQTKGKKVSYAVIDQVRKDVGRALNSKAGPFKDEDSARLAQIYGALTESQEATLGAVNPKVLSAYQKAKGMVAQRKGLEKSAVSLFGKDMLGGKLNLKIRQAAMQVARGGTYNMRKLMEDVPKPYRADAAAFIMDELFRIGTRGADGVSEGFTKTYANLRKNQKTYDELASYLPRDSQKFINDIGRVWTGLIRSKQLQNNSRTARNMLYALDKGGALNKIAQIGGAEAMGNIVGLPQGVGATMGLGQAAYTKFVKGGKDALQRADDFITSAVFQRAIKNAAMGGSLADKILPDSPVYRRWFQTLPKKDQSEILAKGFVGWLVSENPNKIGAGMTVAPLVSSERDNNDDR